MGGSRRLSGRRVSAALPALLVVAVLVAVTLHVLQPHGGGGVPGAPDDPTPVPEQAVARRGGDLGREASVSAAGDDGPDYIWVGVAPGVTVVDALVGGESPERTREGPSGVSAVWKVSAGLQQAGEAVLKHYRDAGGFELVHHGYLDLVQEVWGCLVLSEEGWAEAAVLSQAEEVEGDGPGCELTIARIGS